MIELFAGTAILCSVAKQMGLKGSLAVDKIKQHHTFATVFQLDLTHSSDRDLLEYWMTAPTLCWVHLAPVCGVQERSGGVPTTHVH